MIETDHKNLHYLDSYAQTNRKLAHICDYLFDPDKVFVLAYNVGIGTEGNDVLVMLATKNSI